MLNVVSKGWSGHASRLSILIYHRVLAQSDELRSGEVDAVAFRWQMRWLSRCFTVLPLIEAIQRLECGKLPVRTAGVTFDDGYADNVEIALPILQETGISATFFIATGYLDGD